MQDDQSSEFCPFLSLDDICPRTRNMSKEDAICVFNEFLRSCNYATEDTLKRLSDEFIQAMKHYEKVLFQAVKFSEDTLTVLRRSHIKAHNLALTHEVQGRKVPNLIVELHLRNQVEKLKNEISRLNKTLIDFQIDKRQFTCDYTNALIHGQGLTHQALELKKHHHPVRPSFVISLPGNDSL